MRPLRYELLGGEIYDRAGEGEKVSVRCRHWENA